MKPRATFTFLSLPALAVLMAAAAPAPAAAQSRPCGLNPSDWCSAPAGDPCGRHRNVAACRADPACYGMRYEGESVVACQLDSRGFASNCPTVGCTSTPPRPAAR
jgi:hypothetical protein